MPDTTPLPHDDDPFSDFIHRDLDLDGLTNTRRIFGEDEDWGALDDDVGDELDDDTADEPSPASRPFSSPFRSFSGPSVTLPPLTDPRWQRGVYTASLPVHAYRQPHPLSGIVLRLSAVSRPPRHRLRYLPEVVPGWTAVHVHATTGFVRSGELQVAPYRWWREHFDDLLTLLLVVLVVAAWLTGKIEQQQTVDSLNATITAQQAQIADLHATLAAVDAPP